MSRKQNHKTQSRGHKGECKKRKDERKIPALKLEGIEEEKDVKAKKKNSLLPRIFNVQARLCFTCSLLRKNDAVWRFRWVIAPSRQKRSVFMHSFWASWWRGGGYWAGTDAMKREKKISRSMKYVRGFFYIHERRWGFAASGVPVSPGPLPLGENHVLLFYFFFFNLLLLLLYRPSSFLF